MMDEDNRVCPVCSAGYFCPELRVTIMAPAEETEEALGEVSEDKDIIARLAKI